MSEKVTTYIEDSVFGQHTNGYLSYMDLIDNFNDLTVYTAKQTLLDYAEEKDGSLHKLYGVSWKLAGVEQYFQRLMDEDALLELLNDPEEYEINDVELLMIASSETSYCNFLCGKRDTELINTFKNIRNFIDFTPSETPIRKKLRFMATGKEKIDSSTKSKPVMTSSVKPKTSSAAFRNPSKAGTQMKADKFFKIRNTK